MLPLPSSTPKVFGKIAFLLLRQTVHTPHKFQHFFQTICTTSSNEGQIFIQCCFYVFQLCHTHKLINLQNLKAPPNGHQMAPTPYPIILQQTNNAKAYKAPFPCLSYNYKTNSPKLYSFSNYPLLKFFPRMQSKQRRQLLKEPRVSKYFSMVT